MKDYNQWASELNVGAYYQKPIPKPTCHHFDTSVYIKSKKRNLSIMNLFKKLLGFLAVLILMSSCARYYTPYKAAMTGGKQCSKWTRIR